MKVLIALTTLFALGSAQFPFGGGGGGFGNLGGGLTQNLGNAASNFGNAATNLASTGANLAGNVVNAAQQGLNSFASILPPVPLLNDVKDFGDFLQQTGKTYADATERQLRESTFEATKNLVDAGNAAFQAGTQGFEMAVNAFSDLTHTEFLRQLTGTKKSAAGDAEAEKYREAPQITHGYGIPDAFDWREHGGVSPVQFQGTCGSCWSFATIGAVEGHVFRKTNRLPILSAQNLVDCGDPNMGLEGCEGGFHDYGFSLIIKQQGVTVADKYPYVNKTDTCTYEKIHSGAEITAFASIPPNDEETMKEVVATLGPIACSINALESLKEYKRSIYDDDECNKGEVNHEILVVGYGSEKGQDYWIVKNSWSAAWGEEGYFRLPRGKNFCGIASECSYPKVK